jgi:hypothetical protein
MSCGINAVRGKKKNSTERREETKEIYGRAV